MDKLAKENTFLTNRIQQLEIEKNELQARQQRLSLASDNQVGPFDELAEFEQENPQQLIEELQEEVQLLKKSNAALIAS